MPNSRVLQYKVLDLLQGLEVEPTENDNGGIYFSVMQQEQRLLVTLWPYAGVVDVTVMQGVEQALLLDITVAVRGHIRYINDKRGQYVEFPDCVLVSRTAFSSEQEEAAFNPNTFGRPMLLRVRPHLSVVFT